MITLSNGAAIPQIGVGTWTLRDETATNNVRLALQAGFRLVDTAQMYENELEVGKGIRLSGIAREDIFLTTKVSTTNMRKDADGIRASINESLEKLATPYINLLLIHWPVQGCVQKTWQVMEEFVAEGKVSALGVSNFNRKHLEELLSYAKVKPVLNQIEVHPLMTQEDNIAYNRSLGIQVQAWGPFGQGHINILDQEVIKTIAQKYRKTPSQVVLRWIVQRDLITIPRAKPNHLAENLEVLSFKLTGEDMDAINGLNQNLRSNENNDPDNFPW